MPDDNAQRQLALAMAERERRTRNERGPSEVAPEMQGGPGSRIMAGLRGADRYAAEAVSGALSFLPESITNPLADIGLGRRPENAMQTPGGAAARYMGMAAPLAAGAAVAGTNALRATAGQMLSTVRSPGAFRAIIQDIGRFAQQRPAVYSGSEMAAAAGAGALGQVAKQEGAGPFMQLTAEMVGGLTAGGLTSMAPRGYTALKEGVVANLAPMSNEGGMVRASRQVQERAGGPDRAAELAGQLSNIPEGVTPAQWIGDQVLMAQEARIIADNPDIANVIRTDLERARIAAQESLVDAFGKPRSRQDWEKSVLERVAPSGTKIQPGMTDEMLDQAYRAFTPLYESAKGFEVPTAGMLKSLNAASKDPEIIATTQEREAVRSWLSNQYKAFNTKLGEVLPSDKLLDLRSRIRDERRAQSKRGNQERSDLLGSAEAELTRRLEESLPDEVVETLRAADSQYRQYKVVENAIYNSGDSALTPEQLSQSIRMGGVTTNSRYARGVDPVVQSLREAAIAGRSTEEIIGDPRRASLFVRGIDDDGKRAVQADFMSVLFNRAKEGAIDATEAGTAFIRGDKLIRDLNENAQVMRAIGMDNTDIQRVQNMAQEIVRLERKSPQAVASLYEDGPASVLQLVAALAGSKSGQRISGGGLGSSLVMAQYMSNRARQTLARMTSNEAERLMRDAATDPVLYRAMLTKSLAGKTARADAQYLESWILASMADKLQDDQ
jgi:hypothetical protein